MPLQGSKAAWCGFSATWILNPAHMPRDDHVLMPSSTQEKAMPEMPRLDLPPCVSLAAVFSLHATRSALTEAHGFNYRNNI